MVFMFTHYFLFYKCNKNASLFCRSFDFFFNKKNVGYKQSLASSTIFFYK